jgi:hypothetical protein
MAETNDPPAPRSIPATKAHVTIWVVIAVIAYSILAAGPDPCEAAGECTDEFMVPVGAIAALVGLCVYAAAGAIVGSIQAAAWRAYRRRTGKDQPATDA